MRPEIVISDPPGLGATLASDFEAEGHRAIAGRGRFSIAIPGGSVALNTFPNLARLPFDWSQTDFFWVDERSVPVSDPESNYALAHSLWLEPAGIPAGRIHRMPADDPDPYRAASAYASQLKTAVGDPPRLDYVLLGVGPDGHVASLFPGHPLLANERDLVAVVEDAPKPPPRRLTLTLPVLAAAERLVVVALGESKARVIHDALRREISTLPLTLVIARARRTLLLLDPKAAALV